MVAVVVVGSEQVVVVVSGDVVGRISGTTVVVAGSSRKGTSTIYCSCIG